MNKNQGTKGGAVINSSNLGTANFFDHDNASRKHPIFDAMVKNFSQMAYINSSGKGLELYP